MQIKRPWLRCAVLGLVLASSMLVAGTASAADEPANYDGPNCPYATGDPRCTNDATTGGAVQVSDGSGDNIVECFVKLTTNPAATTCNADQFAEGGANNIVRIDILIAQSAAAGVLDGRIELDISQENSGSGANLIEGTAKIVQKMTEQSSSDISQTEDALIRGDLFSQTDGGNVVVDLDPLIDMAAKATAKDAANVVQEQNPEIDIEADLASDSGDIDAQFKPGSAQKLVATSRSGSIEQTQSEEGGIFVDVEAHSETGLTDVSSTNKEKQQAEASSRGDVDQEQYGPNILGMQLLSDPGDSADGTLKTTQQCNRDDCFQSNVQDCVANTAGEGNCTLDANQSSDNTSNSQTCSVNAETGGCTIKSPDGETFTCEAPCSGECFSGEGGGTCEGDGEECPECECEICFAALPADPGRAVSRPRLLLLT